MDLWGIYLGICLNRSICGKMRVGGHRPSPCVIHAHCGRGRGSDLGGCSKIRMIGRGRR